MIKKKIPKRLNINIFIILILSITAILKGFNRLNNQDLLVISAIPDQNSEILNRRYNLLAKEISDELDIPVKYIPVINYPAAVSGFRNGDLDLVWFGGLTGVQARLQTPNSIIIAQREIDREFKSVFIANSTIKINPINSVENLSNLKGKRLTFGSENSTSGRLMPQYYLEYAGVKFKDLKGGAPGFSGSHDATIALVESGTYEIGALNKIVWLSNVKNKSIDTSKVKVIWTTPPYSDYHWLAQSNLDKRFGSGTTDKLKNFILNLDKNDPEDKIILDLFSANKFIPAFPNEYKKIEQVGRKIGKIK